VCLHGDLPTVARPPYDDVFHCQHRPVMTRHVAWDTQKDARFSAGSCARLTL
jgi:hypothetical protein